MEDDRGGGGSEREGRMEEGGSVHACVSGSGLGFRFWVRVLG